VCFIARSWHQFPKHPTSLTLASSSNFVVDFVLGNGQGPCSWVRLHTSLVLIHLYMVHQGLTTDLSSYVCCVLCLQIIASIPENTHPPTTPASSNNISHLLFDLEDSRCPDPRPLSPHQMHEKCWNLWKLER